MSCICIIIAKYSNSSSSSSSGSQKQSKSELTFAGFDALFQLLDNKVPFLKGKPGLLLRSLSLSLSLSLSSLYGQNRNWVVKKSLETEV
jgi:hypothetical protein